MRRLLAVALLLAGLVAPPAVLAQVGGTPGVTTPGGSTPNPVFTGTLQAGTAAANDPLILSPAAKGANSFTGTFTTGDLTANRTFTFPNFTGTVLFSSTANEPDTGNSVWANTGSFLFEGPTANAFETELDVVDPTADNVIFLPDASGTVALVGTSVPSVTANAVDTGNSVWANTGSLIFEGPTANGFETELDTVDPTAARTIFLPDASGDVALVGQFNYQIPDSGDGAAATYTYQPTAGHSIATFDCLDADGCDLSVGETAATPGMRLIVTQTAATAGTVTLKNAAGVCDLDGAADQALTVGGTVQLAYIASTWIQVAIFFDLS